MSFAEKSDAFVAWLRSRSCEISEKLNIHDYRSQHQGRGIIATDDIQVGENLFTIPRSKVMAIDNDDEFQSQIPEVAELDEWPALILYMLKAEQEPEWKPYFDILPTEFTTLMFWNEEELKHLQGSSVVHKIGREEAEETYHELISPLVQRYPAVFQGCNTSLDNFHRMASLIMSYSFDVLKKDGDLDDDESDFEEDQYCKAMVPLADTLNAHTKLCNAHLHDEGDVLIMKAVTDIKAGEQIYNTYGNNPNCDLLRKYGYVEEGGNDFDIAEIRLEEVYKELGRLIKNDDLTVLHEKIADEDEEFEFEDIEFGVDGKTEPIALGLLLSIQLLSSVKKSDNVKRRDVLKLAAKYAEKYQATSAVKEALVTVLENRLAEYPKLDCAGDVDNQKMLMSREIVAGELRIIKMAIDVTKNMETVDIKSLMKQLVDHKRPSSGKESSKKRRK